jgi:hypothetical protein
MGSVTSNRTPHVLRLIVALASGGFMVACDSADRGLLASECTETIGGVQYFAGLPQCFESLPQRPISGFWVVGHEYSVFYPTLPSEIWELDPAATWLNYSKEGAQAAERYLGDGEFHVLEVEFVGATSDRDGHYGPGEFKSGVYISRLNRIAEVPNVHPKPGMPPNTSLERTRAR